MGISPISLVEWNPLIEELTPLVAAAILLGFDPRSLLDNLGHHIAQTLHPCIVLDSAILCHNS